jgi:hypothetical protein
MTSRMSTMTESRLSITETICSAAQATRIWLAAVSGSPGGGHDPKPPVQYPRFRQLRSAAHSWQAGRNDIKLFEKHEINHGEIMP